MAPYGRTIVRMGGYDLAYCEAGAGPATVLLHGTLTSLDDMMAALAPTLTPARRVVAFDRPGHGWSTRPSGEGSLRAQADRLVDGFARLGLERPILVGHSAGGALALTIALRHPGAIAGVIALAPLVFFEPRVELLLFGPRGLPFVGPFAAQTWLRPGDAVALPLLWNAIFLPRRMPARFAEVMPFERLAGVDEMVATGEDALALAVDLPANTGRYMQCAVPVRVLAGGADVVVNNRLQGRLLPQLMPDCSFEPVAGAGHMIHHVAPDRVRAAVDRLAASLGSVDRDAAPPRAASAGFARHAS